MTAWSTVTFPPEWYLLIYSHLHVFELLGWQKLGLTGEAHPAPQIRTADLLVFRHGDRTPISTFPTNPVKEDVWPQGYEQLTKIGIQQHYSLGQYIRKTYSKLLSEEYKRKEIYVYSTDYDRTIMSAQANLAGLFPPVGKQIWNNKLLWQPIPVHTMPQSQEKASKYVMLLTYQIREFLAL
uniref:acid phosphatase n=1 Tax=Anolis carolinensis TaxID=28377 RepID=A0A803SX77_ANOCA